ncbi:uncharacterized protein [Bemisia tabaci]
MIIYPPQTPSMALSNSQFTGSKFRGGSRGNFKKARQAPTPCPKRQVVHWKQNNIKQGIVVVDEQQLSKLIKTDPIENHYELDPEPFATGIFASVRRCKSLETGEVFAAKFSSRTRYGEDCSAEIHHEIALLSLCSPSPRIIRLHDVFQTPSVIIIVMEFAPGGDLQTIIDDNLVPFESDVVKFVQHVVEGLAYLHQRKIAHLDIKPQNLVMMGDFPNCDIKVCDFEISRVVLKGTDVREILGTPDYVAPEILHYEPITLAADMWSLGVTTYVLLTGFSPFGGETDQETFCNISQAQLDFPDELFEDVSEEAKDFIKRLLIRDPSERMSAKECLRHPWIMKHRKTPLTPAASRTNLQVEKPELSEGRGRVGCSSCSQTPNLNKRNLRKYLSKSREALFERVVSQHRLASELEKKENSLRKSTLLNQYNKTRRLCESQMNLISKSRERQLLCEQGLSPNFSKSREKLYGLRSLSKSHEVLNLGLCQRIKTTNDSGTKTAKPESKQHLTLPTPYSITHSNSTSKLEISNDITSVIGSCDKNKDADKENSLSPKSRRNSAAEKEDQKDKPEVEAAPEASVREGDADGDCHSSSTDSDDLSGSCENICDDQEPRFTVQQLISAYNLHQEVVTKTSLEVTMSLSDNQENKIIPTAILNTAENHKFPTGPNALRLFIPDIDIAMRRTRRRSSKTSSITTIEESVDEGKVPDAVLERLKDPSSSPSCSNPSTPPPL